MTPELPVWKDEHCQTAADWSGGEGTALHTFSETGRAEVIADQLGFEDLDEQGCDSRWCFA